MKVSLMMLIISHLLADFFFQSNSLVEKKSNNIKYLLIHAVIYLVLILLPCMLYGKAFQIISICVVVGTTHFIVDFLKIKTCKNFKTDKASFWIFIVDQLIHFGVLFIASFFLTDFNIIGNFFIEQYSFAEAIIGIDFQRFLLHCAIFLIMFSPSGVFIKLFLMSLPKEKAQTDKPNESKDLKIEKSTIQAGSVIGYLERVIILVLGLLGQYASIGLVLTAKSIARYNRISNEPDFAERYLVGTLLSLFIAIIGLIILK